jgi:hypothetical protein
MNRSGPAVIAVVHEAKPPFTALTKDADVDLRIDRLRCRTDCRLRMQLRHAGQRQSWRSRSR